MEPSSTFDEKNCLPYVEAMSHLKLRPVLKAVGISPPKRPLSKFQGVARQPQRDKIELRPKEMPFSIPRSVKQSLLRHDYPSEPRTSEHERNQYTTDEFRAAIEVIEKAYEQYEEKLPLHQRSNSSCTIDSNANELLQKTLGPEESILPTKLNLSKAKKGEVKVVDPTLARPILRPKSTEYVTCWKEIELLNILKWFKLKEIETIDIEMRAEELAYNAKKHHVVKKAEKLEQLMLENEDKVATATHTLHVQDVLAKKDEQIRALNKKVGNLYRGIDESLAELDGLRKIQLFFFKMSPISWRESFDYLNPVEEGNKTRLVSLYGKKGLGDGLTGDHVEEVRYLESLNELEDKHKKVMFFEDPRQLLAALEDAEDTNLAIIQDGVTLEARREELEMKYGKRIKELDVIIKETEKMVSSLSKQAEFQKDHAHQMETVTKMYGMGEDYQEYERALMLKKIKGQVEQTYVDIFSRAASDFSMLNQLMDVEKKYVQLVEATDFLEPHLLSDLKAKFISDERKMLTEEEEHACLLNEYHQLKQRMARALAPPPSADERCRRLVKSRSAPPHKRRSNLHKSKSSVNSPATTRHRTDCNSLESLQKIKNFEF